MYRDKHTRAVFDQQTRFTPRPQAQPKHTQTVLQSLWLAAILFGIQMCCAYMHYEDIGLIALLSLTFGSLISLVMAHTQVRMLSGACCVALGFLLSGLILYLFGHMDARLIAVIASMGFLPGLYIGFGARMRSLD